MTDDQQAFQHFIQLRDLPSLDGRMTKIKLSEDELGQMADFLGIVSLDKARVEYRLDTHGRDGWRVTGTVFAALTQACVVTLDPVPQVIEEPFERSFEPGAAATGLDDSLDVLIDIDEEDPPEPLGTGIDVAAVVMETLALALDPYPRTSDAVFTTQSAAPEGVAPLDTGAVKPFAGLAALKKAMEAKE